jgi:hypothetical protein
VVESRVWLREYWLSCIAYDVRDLSGNWLLNCGGIEGRIYTCSGPYCGKVTRDVVMLGGRNSQWCLGGLSNPSWCLGVSGRRKSVSGCKEGVRVSRSVM